MRTQVASLLLLAFVPAAAAAVGTDVVRNDKVAVSQGAVAPGETQTWPGAHPSVIVYLGDGSLSIVGAGDVRVKKGQSVFEPAKPLAVKNTGASPLAYARVEFLGNGLPETWGKAGLAPHYKLMFENQYARVYDIRIPAGTNEPRHTHYERVVICLSGAQLKHLMPDGREEPSTLRTGEIVWRRGGTHIGQNLGKTDLWVIAVEPK